MREFSKNALSFGWVNKSLTCLISIQQAWGLSGSLGWRWYWVVLNRKKVMCLSSLGSSPPVLEILVLE